MTKSPKGVATAATTATATAAVSTRFRSRSESDTKALRTPPQKSALTRKISSTSKDLLEVVSKKQRPISPLARDLLLSQTQTDSDASDSNTAPESGSKTSKRPALKRCPCGKSSEGKSWLLNCTACGQNWHNSCANLKGNLPKTVIAQLDHWQCPWCFTCPYEAPKSHKSIAIATSLSTSVFSDAIVTKIEESISSSLKAENTELMANIKTELNKLSEGIKEFAQPRNQREPEGNDQASLGQPQQPISSVKAELETHQCDPYSSYKDNFLNEEQAGNITRFLSQESFTAEGSRKVSAYGERYHYKGSNGSAKQIPEALAWLISKVKEEMHLDYDLNQVLVNKYDTSDNLPPHSDNEGSIRPDSSIITVSLGSSGKIEFSHMQSGNKEELTVEPRSLYAMSRNSQNYYKHQVLANTSDQIRYSITLRCVHWTYFNSTYAVGDSNFGHIEFGSGKGKVGTATPGVKDWAACVKDIDPTKCASYRNIVIMCGTNDLKVNDPKILEIYQGLKGKIEQIREINPHGKIFVCPVLPSRSQALNQRINAFNRYLFGDLQQSNSKVTIVNGFSEFVDPTGLLKTTLHDKRSPTDVLHINNKGYCILVKLIKQAIFGVKKSKSKVNTGRPFSSFFRP